MNLILYGKYETNKNGFLEFLQNNSAVNVLMANTKQEVLNHFGKSEKISRLIFWNIAIPSDLGLIQFVKENYPGTKILVFASPIIKQSIEVIKGTEIEVLDNSFDELKKIHFIISDD